MADDFSKTTIYEENKELAGEVLESLVSSFTTRSNNSDWLSKDGAKAIQEKTDNITSYFYSSDKNGNFYNYDSYIGNWTNKLSKELWASNYKSWLMAIESIKNNESITQTYGKISDAFLANAFYMPDENTITITLGYLFSYGDDFRTYSTEELYSSLGFVMGHELTHGFDSNGSYYDKNGKKFTTSILPEADDKIFKEKQVQVIKNYDKKECCPCEFFANDEKITISEAMADIGGFSLVLEMAKNNNNFNYKSFFKYVAKHMASKKSVLVTAFTYTDVHPFGKVRSNTLLSNSDKFISTFDIKPDDAMWMAPENRVTIW